MYNFKLVNHCWNCNKEHELNNQLAQTNVKCDCGGYVLTPSGKGLHEIKLTCNVYKIHDGENHWIAANTEREARELFEKDYSDDLEYTVELVTTDDLHKKTIDNIEFIEEDGTKWTSLKQIVLETKHIPSVIASSVY